MFEGLRLYIKWCVCFRQLLPWEVSLVSDRELSKEEYEYPEKLVDIVEDWRLAHNKEFIKGMRKILKAMEDTDFDIKKVRRSKEFKVL